MFILWNLIATNLSVPLRPAYTHKTCIMTYLFFYFRTNCDWRYQKACGQCVQSGMWYTHTLHKNKQSVHTHTQQQTVFDSVQYIQKM